MRLVTALLCKNEADRYLPRVIYRCREFSDEVLVLDDGSTDNTVQVATDLGCLVKQRPKSGMWGNESPARAELWDRGAKLAKGEWLLICDADMLLHGNPRDLCHTTELSAWSFVLWDCWDGEHQARTDGPWQLGPVTPRSWLFHVGRCMGDRTPEWNTRGLHTGHHPLNIHGVSGLAPTDLYWWQHLGWVESVQRAEKVERYLSVSNHLTEFEIAHARSALET